MTILILIVTLFYVLLIGYFAIGFDRLPYFSDEESEPNTGFSIIIPFRNEAENLPELLASISHLNYPKNLFECIFVDDDSQDFSVNKITEMMENTSLSFSIIKNTRVSHSPKKDAITKAIHLAKHEWIITTDADCIVPNTWLTIFDNFIKKNAPSFITGPVNYVSKNNFLGHFQALDFMSLMGATIGGFGIKKPFLCNGANLAYRKDFFNTVNGFKGNNTIASGDDIFLLEKALKLNKNSVRYLKNNKAIVLTKPESSLANLISQRVRWASKTVNYNNWFGKFTGVIVLFMNAALLSVFVLSCVQLFNIKTVGYIFLIKFAIDFLLLFKTIRFFKVKKLWRSVLLSSIIYPIFTVGIAFKSVFSSYKWKGRQFSK